MAGDKAVLADHDGQPAVLCDGHRLYVIIIYFLIVLCVDLDPAAVSAAHGVRMVVVDVDRSSQSSVDYRHGDRQSAGCCYIEQLPHQSQSC